MTVATATFMGILKCSKARRLHEKQIRETCRKTLWQKQQQLPSFSKWPLVCFICQDYAGCWLLGVALWH